MKVVCPAEVQKRIKNSSVFMSSLCLIKVSFQVTYGGLLVRRKMSSTGELEKVHAEMEALFQQHPHLRTTYKEHHQQHMKNLTRYNAIKDIGQKVHN